METNSENLKKPEYWLQLPLEIGSRALECFTRDMDCLADRAGRAVVPQQARIEYYRTGEPQEQPGEQ